jgi:hypothetical protein
MIKQRQKRIRLAISSYMTVSFDQFPMKSGILPVSSVSDAHLIPKELFPQTIQLQLLHLYLTICTF